MGRKAADIRGLYAIVDSTYIAPEGFAVAVREIIKGGARVVQVRAKGFSIDDIMDELQEARKAAAEGGAIFIINDSPGAALECGADGVHMGQKDGSIKEARRLLGAKAIIGVSTHNTEEAVRAEAAGADYISFGPVYPTRTKKDAEEEKGLAGLSEAATAVSIPVVAIGGITIETAAGAIEAGAGAVAVISDILLSGDMRARAAGIISAINEARP